MDAMWPAEFADAPPEVLTKRHAIAQRTLIARSKPGVFFFPLLAAVYVPVIADSRIDVVVTLIAVVLLTVMAALRSRLYAMPTWSDHAAWRRRYASYAAVNITIWDSLTAFEMVHRNLDAACIVLIATEIGLRASSVYAACPDLRIHQIFARWTRLPLVLAPLAMGSSEGIIITCLVCMHMLYIEANAKQLNREFWEGIVNAEQRERAEIELRLAHKLESVGRLAAGIAHEINTPLQAMMGNLEFLEEGVAELLAMAAPSEAQQGDLDYLRENLPSAVSITNEAVQRTAAIVRSVKTFAHPELTQKAPIDLNRALQNTLDISRHEYAMVADVEVDFGDLPLVDCYAGELNQALLNIVVNAAHAIAARHAETGSRGIIRVATCVDGDRVRITIGDTGGGIPDAIRDRIFDPFFTTKGVGKGTGQGLAIARSVITLRHGGELTFESQPGQGTTFFIQLPGTWAQYPALAVAS